MALSFNFQGSNTQDQTNALSGFLSKFGSGNTTASSALNAASQPSWSAPKAPAPTTPTAPQSATTSAQKVSGVLPSTPVKKVTTNNVDGSSHTIEYHSPAPSPSSSSNFSGVTQGGQYGAGGGFTAPNTTNNPNPPAVPTAPADNSSVFSGLLNRAATSAGANENIGNRAAQIASEYGQKIADVGGQGARAQAGYLTTGTTPVAEGNAAVIAQTTAAQQKALAEGGQMALTGTAQQLTGQNQQTAGILGAANAASPTGAFPFVFDPATGTFKTPTGTAGTAGAGAPTLTYNPQTDANNLASLVIANKVPFADAVNALGYAGAVGKGLLTTAIASQGGDLTKIQAQNAVTQSNITTAGTAEKSAAATGYTGAVQERANADASYSKLSGISSQLTGTLSKWGQSGTLTDYNKAINSIASHLSSPDYQAFIVALGNTQAAYQSILGSAGVTPTKADQDAMNALSANSSASAIVSALNQLSKDAYSLIVEPSYSKVATYESQLGI